MTKEEAVKAMKENGKITFVPHETTFTADEILNNLWNTLNSDADLRGQKIKPNDADYRTMGIIVDMLYSKINFERRMRINNSLIETTRKLTEDEIKAIKGEL